MAECPTRLEGWLQLIRAEFDEPWLPPMTPAQARARWPLEVAHLTGILDALARVGYLSVTPEGAYCRRRDQEVREQVAPRHGRGGVNLGRD